MKVSDYLEQDCCVMDLKAQDKEGAIGEIVEVLTSRGKVAKEDKFIKDVLERESLGSTGIGNNVAIPHARTSAVRELVIGFGRSKAGIEFKALDGEPVKLIFLMGADPQDLNLYLRILAELSKLLMNSSFRQELLAASKKGELIDIIKKFEKS